MPHPVRRVVTGHDQNGKAIIVSDGPASNVMSRGEGEVASTLVWVVDEAPADISGAKDRADRKIGIPPPPNGHILRVVEFPPVKGDVSHIDNADVLRSMGLDPAKNIGGKARHPFMHRTRSIDYAIVIDGEIDMLLDDSEVHLKAGDILIQQGTNHAWVNNGTRPCRIAFVLIDAVEPPQWSRRG